MPDSTSDFFSDPGHSRTPHSDRPVSAEHSDAPDLTGLVSYVANALITDEQATVESTETRNGVIIKLHVSEENMGRVIGKDGRIANALRTLLRAGSASSKKRVMLDIE